jgi:voltage-gated potassium channel Kch
VARTTLRNQLRARFDRTMDRGTPALIGWLGLASLALVVVVSVPIYLFAPNDNGNTSGNFFYVVWESMLRTIDTGTIGGDQNQGYHLVFLAMGFIATMGGIFIVSAFIGVLTTGINARIEELRKGRAPVIEKGHTVILGWSDQIFTVVAELARANQGGKRSSVVILATQDKVDMEDQIRGRLGDIGRTRVVCRSGSPLKRADLDMVNMEAARSVIVLSPPGDDPDIDVIKMLLLLQYRPWPPKRPHVVAAVQHTENLTAARLAGGAYAQIIDADDIAVRLVVQSHRQAGLSTVCTDLLNFDGNEIYMKAEPKLVGRTYGEALHAFDLGCPIGLCHADGTVSLNPTSDTKVGPDDQIILIAEDDLLVRLASAPAHVHSDAIVTETGADPLPDRTLLVGWNARARRIIELLDRLVEPGSILDVASAAEPDRSQVNPSVLTLGFRVCQPTSRSSLEQDLDLGSYRHIIVLADDTVDPDHADDRTLVTLLHLRDIEVSLGDPYSIITEMNDDANREVAQVTKADDFIVSSKLISLLITQLAENRHLHQVFAELFDPSGAEIYLKPASAYVRPGVTANFATVIEAARLRGETAIGVRSRSQGEQAPGYGVVLNPSKAAPLTLSADDSIVLVAAN